MHEQADRIQELFLQGVQMLARALEAKDAYTRGHSIRVSQYAVATARAAGVRRGSRWTGSGWAASCTTSARSAPARRCCTSPARSPTTSSARSREHPLLGERMLSPLAQETPDVLRIVRSHHERIDGRGFPDGLRGEKIPIEARIVAVADAFDAMTTRRPYRESRSPRTPSPSCAASPAPSSTPAVERSPRVPELAMVPAGVRGRGRGGSDRQALPPDPRAAPDRPDAAYSIPFRFNR